jgi:hypothetical protein
MPQDPAPWNMEFSYSLIGGVNPDEPPPESAGTEQPALTPSPEQSEVVNEETDEQEIPTVDDDDEFFNTTDTACTALVDVCSI